VYNSCGDNSGCRKDLSSVAIAGIVVGSIVGFFVLVGIAVYIACNMSKRKKMEQVT